ncbi:MAG: molybdenum cofactor guanylyltransferase [Vicinamibacterales bacterium]
MVDRQLDALRARFFPIFVVGQQTPREAVNVVHIDDRVHDAGPLGGLDAALDAANGSAVLLLACDMPWVSGPLLSFLAAQLDGVDAVVPKTERGYHPLCAVYAASCRTAVLRRLETRHLRLRDLLDDVRTRVVEGSDYLAQFGEPSHLLANVNTQADLDALESQRNH